MKINVEEGEYTYSIEKIYIKELKRDEVRFCVYKATRRGDETYIPRSLDVTELELIKEFNKIVELCNGTGYEKETLVYIDLEIGKYIIKLIPVKDSYSYIYTYIKQEV